ncbi:MAG TPA: response regulator [Pyrinomonadaceae bacterium]|nr:response regulator [Pyrinomonadaceae bacterium]
MQFAQGPADGAIQLKGLVLLAGRKLLLADDSATIQKVIDLTFADEGVRVVAVGNGQEALDQLLDFAPDIVLADVHMPAANGYEVCEYVKTNEKLKHIPVVLLVGSFEPFDEAEARRVGADDILTKPFQSIRRLIDRVGALVSSPPAEKALEKEGPTAELPRSEVSEEPAEEPRLTTGELEMTTADTLPLEGHPLIDTMPRVDKPVISESPAGVTPSARLEAWLDQTQTSSHEEGTSLEPEGTMEPVIPEMMSDSRTESPDVLLDLGELETARAAESDDFVLDLDDDQETTYEAPPMRAFVEPEVRETVASASAYESSYQPQTYQPSNSHSSFEETQEVPYAADVQYDVENVSVEPEATYESSVPPELTPDPVPVFGETEFPVTEISEPATTDYVNRAAQSFTADQLSPEMIDAIARRAVELMSDKVIREIAWEVVPDLAELLIKRQLEERAK